MEKYHLQVHDCSASISLSSAKVLLSARLSLSTHPFLSAWTHTFTRTWTVVVDTVTRTRIISTCMYSILGNSTLTTKAYTWQHYSTKHAQHSCKIIDRYRQHTVLGVHQTKLKVFFIHASLSSFLHAHCSHCTIGKRYQMNIRLTTWSTLRLEAAFGFIISSQLYTVFILANQLSFMHRYTVQPR